jgi:hypothetical protein
MHSQNVALVWSNQVAAWNEEPMPEDAPPPD